MAYQYGQHMGMMEGIPYEEPELEGFPEAEPMGEDMGFAESFMGRMRSSLVPEGLDVEQALADPSFTPNPDPRPSDNSMGFMGDGLDALSAGDPGMGMSSAFPEDSAPTLPTSNPGQGIFKDLLYRKMQKRRDRSERFQQLAQDTNRKMFQRY